MFICPGLSWMYNYEQIRMLNKYSLFYYCRSPTFSIIIPDNVNYVKAFLVLHRRNMADESKTHQ